jgi:hypothetical protein
MTLCIKFLQQLYQDGMAVIRAKGKPDLFVTVTCNPNWHEISSEIKDVQNSQKLTIIARVFNIKLKAILDDIFKKKILGNVHANMYVIEFQKRGLPHAHILIILSEESKLRNTDEFDSIISAEFPDRELNPLTFETVTRSMIHGPCGIINPSSPCMVDGVCSKNFPKPFCEATIENDDGYPQYMRRDNGQTHKVKITKKNTTEAKEVEVDNRWIVPYNPYLTTKYNCHINVEICSSVQAVKYLFKYIYKGPDKAQTVLEPANAKENNQQENDVDEIKDYVDARYISGIEAVWHIFHFLMHEQGPSVIRLDTHLENDETVVFKDDEILDSVKNKPRATKLTAWFDLNTNEKEANEYLYHDIPKFYVWKNEKRI